jgi:mannose-6-phosphate isomerase-like protein (cupin superfamily)
MFTRLLTCMTLLTVGCIEHREPPPPVVATSPGAPRHWDIGSTIYKTPLPEGVDDGYVELAQAPGFSYGVTIAREGLSARNHERSDLLFYVHRGSADFSVGDKTFPARLGDVVYIPRGAIYAAHSTSKEPLHLVTIYSPPLNRSDIIYHERADHDRSGVEDISANDK